MAPRKVDKQAKRKAIAHAAVGVFARTGVSGARMVDIAREAGIGKGTIYEYFRSKDEIFVAVFELFQEQMDAEIGRRVWSVSSPQDRLDGLIDAFVNTMLHEGESVRITLEFWAAGVSQRDQGLDVASMYDKYLRYVSSVLQEGIDAGAFRAMDTWSVAANILGALDGLMLQWFLNSQAISLPAASEELKTIVRRGIVA